jgi:predicted transcriptional regulator
MDFATDALPRDFLFSIRPGYVKKIIDGTKTVELRRRFVTNPKPGSIAFIYSTSPVQAIVASADIMQVSRLPLEVIWQDYGPAAGVRRQDFDKYFAGLVEGYAIRLTNVRRLDPALSASALRDRFGFVPPQSFRYVPEEYYTLLDHDRVQATHRHQCLHRA